MIQESFTYLDTIDSTILYDIRYAGSMNFVGKVVDGYHANRPIMTHQLAKALSKIQKAVSKDGLSLVIYDAYRPQKAVEHFTRWSEDKYNQGMKTKFYPYVDKTKAFELGFVAKQSAHSRGSTVDLTLIDKNKTLKQPHEIICKTRFLKDGREILFLDDGTVDMGSHFDLFDEASFHQHNLLEEKYMSRRTYLRNMMMKHGFDDYRKEWWHYSLIDEPFPQTGFNFDVR
jgi:D-alanyl-D-alanine dipeptidase